MFNVWLEGQINTEPVSAPAESSNQSTGMVGGGHRRCGRAGAVRPQICRGLERENRQLKLMVHSPAGSALCGGAGAAGMQGKHRVDRR